jgi:SAM-dependent methyltransferase
VEAEPRTASGAAVARWDAGLDYEVTFWERWLETQGAEWPEDFARRVADVQPVTDGLLLECLSRLEVDPIAVLDVGAGPISLVGTLAPGKTIRLTAVDPLAEKYARLLSNAGIHPRVPTERCDGERLLEKFERGSFDVAYARNCVDHSYDPILVIESMLGVVRPGGFVVLEHWANEGERENYSGLHQWNFDLKHGKLLLWNASSRRDVGSSLQTPALAWFNRDHDGWLVCVFQRATQRGRGFRWFAKSVLFRAGWSRQFSRRSPLELLGDAASASARALAALRLRPG